MTYTIYRKSKVIKVEEKTAVRPRGTREIVDPNRAGLTYTAVVATLEGIPGTISVADFYTHLHTGDVVTVAVDQKMNMIALVNHSRGESHCLTYSKTSFSNIFGILFFISIPALLSFFIARNAFLSAENHTFGYYVIGAGALIVLLILIGVNKQYIDSKAALRKILSVKE